MQARERRVLEYKDDFIAMVRHLVELSLDKIAKTVAREPEKP